VKPRLLIVAGGNGAGKSTLTARLVQCFGNRLGAVLDADAIARALNPDDPSKSAISAARTVLLALDSALQNRERLVYETTLSDRNRHLELLERARLQGFEVWVLYVGLGRVERHLQRVQARVLDGGHDVPAVDVVRRYSRSLRNLSSVLLLADRVLIYDNSGLEMRRVASVQSGQVRRKVEDGWWTELLESLPFT
jgi:predicted ABC-type ATPase